VQKHIEEIRSFISSHRDEMILMWQNLVDTVSQARDCQAATIMCKKLKDMFEQVGFNCTLHDVGPVNAPALVGVWGANRPGAPILFSGHYDTVSLPGEQPFRIDEVGHAHGLACLDMKGGIVIAMYVVKALQSIGWTERPIKFLFVGDEEKGHQQANTPELIIEHSRGALCAFNMETGLINNNICVGRKGGGVGSFTVHGVGSHSGNDFLRGRNSIAEMAYKILELQALTNLELGTTVSVTIIKGGTVPNSIPPKCGIDVDVRYEMKSECDRVVAAMHAIAAKNYIDGCSTTFEYNEYMAPFETTPNGIALANFVAEISKESGLGEMGQTQLGGGSDASYITIAGVPTVCSMGVRGEFNHTDMEYAVIETLFERTELLCHVVLRIHEFASRRI
jgi:glutamate carboxypeptidase